MVIGGLLLLLGVCSLCVYGFICNVCYCYMWLIKVFNDGI